MLLAFWILLGPSESFDMTYGLFLKGCREMAVEWGLGRGRILTILGMETTSRDVYPIQGARHRESLKHGLLNCPSLEARIIHAITCHFLQ